ncbi:MAG: UbiA family prenyltransferase [Betaproteobacteria bacterium]|nr:UbiA family prenyltransferase [Betaproteobacteria bacterium]
MTGPSELSAREIWIRLLLYPSHTLPTAAAPVLVGIGLALRDHIFAALPMLIAFLGSWLIHVGGVFNDNYELLRRHPHVPEHPELLQALQSGTLTFTGLRYAILTCFGLAVMAAPYMLSIGGMPALVIGVAGVASGYFYAGGPQPYVKHGLADPIFVVMFGIVAVVGTYYIAWAALHPAAFHGLDALLQMPWDICVIGLPVGALVTNVMLIDDIRDRHFDAVKGWHTFAVRFGLGGIRGEYLALTVLAYLLPLAFWLWLGCSAWIFLPLLTLPMAYKIWQAVSTLDQTKDLIMMSPRASYLSLIYAALLAVGVAMPVH